MSPLTRNSAFGIFLRALARDGTPHPAEVERPSAPVSARGRTRRTETATAGPLSAARTGSAVDSVAFRRVDRAIGPRAHDWLVERAAARAAKHLLRALARRHAAPRRRQTRSRHQEAPAVGTRRNETATTGRGSRLRRRRGPSIPPPSAARKAVIGPRALVRIRAMPTSSVMPNALATRTKPGALVSGASARSATSRKFSYPSGDSGRG
jgi:hypothetical protein